MCVSFSYPSKSAASGGDGEEEDTITPHRRSPGEAAGAAERRRGLK